LPPAPDAAQTIPLSSELTIAKSLTITGSVPVTVSGGGSVRIFAVNAGVQATLAGLTLDNGVADSGGAIHNAGALTVTHSGVYNSAAGNGGGLYNEGVLVVQASTLSGNTATDPIGGGGAVFNTGVLTLTDSRLAGNAGEFGAALVNLSGGAWVQRSTFANNRANTAGAGIYTSAGVLHIAECTFTGNATGSDAGAYGGALVTDGGELFVTRTTFANNRAFNGGGVYLMGAGVAAIHNSTLAGNLATNSGGGLYNESSILGRAREQHHHGEWRRQQRRCAKLRHTEPHEYRDRKQRHRRRLPKRGCGLRLHDRGGRRQCA
jgi:hypothetical protein